jgi:hypothetical protein
MAPTSLQTERLILTDPLDSRLRRDASASDRIVAALNNPELIALVIFCALGLLATVALYIAFPSFGELATSLQAFL